jgi:hypothetical protein
MSRRFWLGTPKGQYTSAITSFLTSRLTNTSFTTSAPTLSPTTFITQWYTPTPTSNLTDTTYPTLFTDPGVDTEYSNSFVTNYITNWVYPVSTAFDVNTIFTPTSNQTFKGNYNTAISTILTPGSTQYTVPTTSTSFTPTPTSYTSFTPGSTQYTVPTTSTSYTPTGTVYTSYTPTPTDYPVLTPTPTNYTYFFTYPTQYSRPTAGSRNTTSYDTDFDYRPTDYERNTAVAGYYYTTFDPTSYDVTYPSSASGCYYYNVDGDLISQDSIPSNCSIVSCSPAVNNYSPGQRLTAYTYFQATFYTSTYISNVTTYSTTSSNTYVGQGLTSPPFAGGCYPEIDAAEYCANPESNCYPCNIYELTSVINTSIQGYSVTATVYYNSGYTLNQYTAVSYLSSACQDCSLSCTDTVNTDNPNPTGGYVAPSSRNTTYSVDTLYGFTINTTITPTEYTYNTGYYVPTQGEGYNVTLTNYTTYTQLSTQYTNLTPGTTQYTSFTPVQETRFDPTTYTNLTPGTTQYTSFTPVQETRFDPTTYTSFSTGLTSTLEPTSYLTETGITTSFRDTDYATSNPTSRTTTTTYLQNTGATAYEVPTSHETTTTYDTDYLTQRETSRDTEVITSWLTDDNVTTSFTTSRSTTWFTQ